jgi:uncharacterized membrane protein
VGAEFDRMAKMSSVPAEAATQATPEVSDTGRLEAFSDGVFAVAITLLVLDLRVPLQADLRATPGQDVLSFLGTQWPNYFAYVTSFLTILVMWINHHALFKLIGRADRVLMIYNGLLLMVVTAVPFSTSLVAEYVNAGTRDQRTVGVIYSGFFVLVSIAFNLLWRYASKERHLLEAATQQAHIDGVNRSFRLGPLAYVVALALTFVDIKACLALCFALAIYYAVPHARQ